MNKINLMAVKNVVKEFSKLLAPRSSLLSPRSTLYALRSLLLAPRSKLLALLLLALLLPGAAEAATPEELQPAPGKVLESGYYTFSGMAMVNATEPGQSALSVASNQTVFIELKNNATLELVGGNATTNQGAGAGLCVPRVRPCSSSVRVA